MVAVTIPALALALLFAAFASIVTYLSFEVDPLSPRVGDCSTGRIELLWTILRVLIAFEFHIQSLITPIGTLLLLGVVAVVLLKTHVQTLPFYMHEFNMLRSGIYATVLWLIVASAILTSGLHGATEQWVLVGLSPIFFIAGALAAEMHKAFVRSRVKSLRAEYFRGRVQETPPEARSSLSGFSARAGVGGSAAAPRRDALREFFDADATASGAFQSARAAHLALRLTLYERDDRGLCARLLQFISRPYCLPHHIHIPFSVSSTLVRFNTLTHSH
jgi:hypothetical protein